MKAGILLLLLGDSVTRDNVLYIAKEAEKEGLDSVWVLERLLLSLKPQTPYAVTPDGSFPAEYQNVLDPLETLTYLAGNLQNKHTLLTNYRTNHSGSGMYKIKCEVTFSRTN